MTDRPRPARVALAAERSQRCELLGQTLESHGHQVVSLFSRDEALSAPEPDLYLIARALADGCAGLELFAALRRAGRTAPVVLFDEQPSFDELRRAIELGAVDFVLRPHAPGELARSVARALEARSSVARAPRTGPPPSPSSYERRYPAEAGTVGRAARELAAFLLKRGVAPAHRVRIASALSEVVDNACRHAYPRSGGELSVSVSVEGTRVLVTVEDRGRGFDSSRVQLDRVPAALPMPRGSARAAGPLTGLRRLELLCESQEIHAGSNGTRVELAFTLTPVRFEEEGEDFSETDFLDPTRARALVAALLEGGTDLSNVSPSLALTIGRLLGGLDPKRRAPSRRRP